MSVHDTTSNIREQLRTMLLRLNTEYDTETCVDPDLNSAMPGHLAPFKGLVPFYRSECSFFFEIFSVILYEQNELIGGLSGTRCDRLRSSCTAFL